MADPADTLHACCVVVGEAGVLIRGPSGTGKSRLARQLIQAAGQDGVPFARLVGDDRIRLEKRHGRLIARSVPAIAGRIEARGLGILSVPYEAAAVVRLVVDGLAEAPERLPGESGTRAEVCGLVLPRIAHRLDDGLAPLILWRLRHLHDMFMTSA